MSIYCAAALLPALIPWGRISAQYGYQSIISADTAEMNVTPLPAPPAFSETASPAAPEHTPAAASSAARTRRPSAQQIPAQTPAARTAEAGPVKIAQAERQDSVSQQAPAAPRAETARQPAPAKLPPEETRAGLLPETANDGIVPPPDDFRISPQEAALLDQFLAKWEEFGKNIKKVSCNVTTKEQGGGLYGEDREVPLSQNYGEFKFIAPNKLLYHISGEFVYEKDENGKKKPEYKKGLGEKKFVLDGKSLTEYDYKNRVALVTPIPEDQQNKDLTMDGPIPIFFIAKADNLKRRFYMKLITKPEKQDSEVWIEAWPRQASDAQSFQRIIITLRLEDLQPYYMRQYHSNGKSYTELWFSDIAINKGLWNIEPKVDFGWKKEEAAPSSVSVGKN